MAGLEEFMYAIGKLESGGNYNAVGPNTGSTYGRARGKYQIMETIWPGWAKEAGIPGASWKDPEAQERVARYKMNQYFQRFGRWDLVAVAWFAGPGRAAEAQRKGIESVGGLKDVIGTSVTKYVQTIMKTMGAVDPSDLAGQVVPTDSTEASARRALQGEGPQPTAGGATPDPHEEFRQGRQLATDNFGSIMEAISRAASAQGGKVLDSRALFGDIFSTDDEHDHDHDEVA